jgi:hypothetical protein
MAIAAAAVVVPVGLLFFASGLIVNLIQVLPSSLDSSTTSILKTLHFFLIFLSIFKSCYVVCNINFSICLNPLPKLFKSQITRVFLY